VDSADNVLVAWPGDPLSSRERRVVQVRVWTDRGASPWSEPTTVEAGLLESSDWASSWVQPVEHEEHEPGFRPAYLLPNHSVWV
jgi:alpha-L-rhamnosidase